jgi:hypothetical protein
VLRVARLSGRQNYHWAVAPEFPIRIITDDGEVEVIESPEGLMERIDSIDSSAGNVWVRDAFDRTVVIRMRAGVVEELSIEA